MEIAEMPPLRRLVIVAPVFNDWICLKRLAGRLKEILGVHGLAPYIVAIDDCSLQQSRAGDVSGASVIVRLTRNVGHQRAIAVGLEYVLRETDADVIAVMDADGEDRPEDLPALLSGLEGGNARVVAASRRRRSEGARFSAFYLAYKTLFRVFTGEWLDFGNFSVLDRAAAHRLMAMHELWLNYPASVMRSRLDLVRISTHRGRRFEGKSQMNLVGLVIHGLSAIGVFSERAFTRTLVAVAMLVAVLAAGLISSLALKMVGLATPGWVTTIAAALAVVLVQTAMVALCGLLVIFSNVTQVALSPAATARTLIDTVDLASDGSGGRI